MIIYKPTKFLVETHRGAGSAGPAGAVRARPADRWSRARATWGPLEPCPRDLRTTGAVHVRHADHWGRVHATCGPQKPCARDLRNTRAVRTRHADHWSRALARASSKQAPELISAYPHISVSIDGTSPKLSWYTVLVMPYNHTKFQVKTHQGAGSVAKKV